MVENEREMNKIESQYENAKCNRNLKCENGKLKWKRLENPLSMHIQAMHVKSKKFSGYTRRKCRV